MIAQVDLLKAIIWLILKISQIGWIASVGQGIETDKTAIGRGLDQTAQQVGADKACSAGYCYGAPIV